MHSTLIAPETLITFIDARGQYFHPYMDRMPLNYIADAQYDELMMKKGGKEKRSINVVVPLFITYLGQILMVNIMLM